MSTSENVFVKMRINPDKRILSFISKTTKFKYDTFYVAREIIV